MSAGGECDSESRRRKKWWSIPSCVNPYRRAKLYLTKARNFRIATSPNYSNPKRLAYTSDNLPPLDDPNGLFELEGHEGFGGKRGRAAFGEDFGKSACARSRGSADRSAFTLPGDCADHRAQCRAAAGVFGGSLVGADTVLTFLDEIG